MKEIGIKLSFSSQGNEKVVSNLQELETELANLQKEIKTLDFGSQAFNEAAKNIQTLKSKIDEVDKRTEGLGAEKKFRALGDAISVATGSFQVLSGVLGLIITDTEDLEQVQKAESAALQVLNVALGINAINTALVESATLRATIATKANTIATNIAKTATAAWNAILLANPIGLVIAGVVALTAAIYGLVKAYNALFGQEAQQEKTLKAINQIEKDLIKTKREAAKDLESQLTILTDNVSTRNLERKVLEDLKKAYPGLNAFIDKNNKLTKQGIEFIKLEIALRQQQAALASVQNKLTEKQVEFEIKSAEIRAEYGASANILIKELKEQYDKDVAPLIAVQDRYTKSLDDTLGALKPYQTQLEKQVKTEEKAKNATSKNNDVLTERGRILQQITKLISNQNIELQKLLETELEYTADVLEKQNEILSNQEGLIKQRTDAFETSGDKIRKQLKLLLREIVPTEDELLKAQDKFQDLFLALGDLAEKGILDFTKPITPKIVETQLEAFKPGLQSFFTNLSDESQTTLLDFFNERRDRVEQINQLDLVDGKRLDIVNKISKAEDEIYELYKNRTELGLTSYQVQERGLALLDKEFGLTQKIEEAQKTITDLVDKKASSQDIQAAEEALKALLDFRKSLEASIVRSIKFYEGIEVITNQTSENLQEINKNVEELKRQLSPQEIEGVVSFFEANLENIDALVSDLFGNLVDYKEKLGDEGVQKLFDVLSKGIKNTGDESRESLENAKKFLEVYIRIGEVLGYNVDEARQLLAQTQNQLDSLNVDKFLDDLYNGLEKLDTELFKLADIYYETLQARSSLFLEQLSADEAAALKAVEGTSDRLLEEQEKIRKEYAKTRFDIEKKARITELRFTLAQTISDSSLAVANTLANIPPPANFALAAITAGLAAAQVLQIRDQLTFVQAQQFVGRRGGMITGQSHEGSNGGVPALLEGGEFVVNKAAVSQYGDLLGDLNSSTGGRRLAIDDSRLVQTIASQNKNTSPIKAYVLYNDIQSTDKLNSRITQLARL